MAKASNPEFRTQGLYGTSIIDHAIDGIVDDPAKTLKRIGALLTIIGALTFAIDTNITSDAADSRQLLPQTGERSRFVNDYRGWRSSAEIWAVVAGIGSIAAGKIIQARRDALFG